MSYGAEEKEAMRQRDADESDSGTDETEATDMTKESTQTDASGIEAEIDTIRGSGSLDNLTCQHTGGNKWTVLSARNGSVDAYQVDVTGPECTCDHGQNKGGTEACGHIAYVLLNGERTVPEEAYQAARVHSAVDKLRDVSGDVKGLYEAMDEHRVRQLSPDSDSGGTENNDDTPEPPTAEEAYEDTARGEEMANAKSPEDAAEELRAAYDAVVDDMQVETNAGSVWVQTGRDTPDTLPGPGNVSVFEAFLQNPEHVEYVHDDHRDASDRPSEWYKNQIAPSDVDEYISEVLE